MTQVSRVPIRKEVESRVYEVLLESIAAAGARKTVNTLLSDLLSPTERLMIAKRLSISLLLIKGYDQRTISKWLKVSLGTVSKVSLVMQTGHGGYQSVIGTILRKENYHTLLQKIDDAMAHIMPPAGKNWSHWRRARLRDKIQNIKAF